MDKMNWWDKERNSAVGDISTEDEYKKYGDSSAIILLIGIIAISILIVRLL